MKHSFDVVYLDNHLLVVNKISGLLTQETNLEENSLQNFCKQYLKEKYSKAGNVFCEPIHRLDKDVSGLVIFARTSKALSRLNAQIRKRSVTKKYVALVEGLLDFCEEKQFTHYLIKENYRAKAFDQEKEGSKNAELFIRPLETHASNTLVEVTLVTGRYHQIRAQLSHIGHPILGDHKYGATSRGKREIALHHKEFSLDHPVTKERLTWTCSPSF